MIQSDTLGFLRNLAKNNNKQWFDANRKSYEMALMNVRDFAGALCERVKTFDTLTSADGSKCVMRIYRDVRFSPDKRPYKSHWGGSFAREGKYRRGGYYFHIEPGNCFVGGGFWAPEPKDLMHIRKQIQAYPDRLRRILVQSSFLTHFGELTGEQVKSVPKGFDRNDPALDLLRYRQFLVMEKFTDEQACSETFLESGAASFKAMLPLFDYMSDILTHDLNGTPIPEDQLPA